MVSKRIRIAIHVARESSDPGGTIDRLRETVTQPYETELLLEPDLEDRLAAEVAGLNGIARTTISSPAGAAACFNALLSQPADVYLFLECGVSPAPGWLDYLLDALYADPGNGLAGPSSDICYNKQYVPLPPRTEAQDIEPMTPLHNLADFCLAVRREVVDAIGGADTAYGYGPCWEMDYCVRAARAGFRSVWAKAAYVRRAPISNARKESECNLIETSKRLYQDRFCGRRTGSANHLIPYHSHCRGEDCINFAPPATTRLHIPLVPAAPQVSVSPATPMISCVMPTRGRARYVAQAVAYFARQDYPNRELIIVYNDTRDLPAGIDVPHVRTIRSTQTSIGGKRQDGACNARGEIIAHWDDDDWYSPGRLSWQAQPIIRGEADITGLNDCLFMTVPDGAFWRVSPKLFSRMFVGNISGGTLMFRRGIWQRSGPYPPISLREDVALMAAAIKDGARLRSLPAGDNYIYVRHCRSTWKFDAGNFLQPQGWSRIPEPEFLAPDRAFYFGQKAVRETGSPELISCIMPTADRRAFLPRSINCFLEQAYSNRELIIVDDGRDCVADLIPKTESIRYCRLEKRTSLGAKRNIACEMARGEIIAHWDDDDWMAPSWLCSQKETLALGNADICGLDSVFFYAPTMHQAWRYTYGGSQAWVCGGTLFYLKDLWRKTRFQEISVGEDNAFVWSRQEKRVAINGHIEQYVATVHPGNTSQKITSGSYWHSIPPTMVENLMSENNT